MLFPTAILVSVISASSAFARPANVVESRTVTGVTGSAPGFATGTTGGGSAKGAYPSSTAQLVEWLTDSTARVILIKSEMNFIGTEGTTTTTGCRPASNKCPGNGGQDAINLADWCTNGNAGAGVKSISVTYDNAAITPISVGSNKSLVGVGSGAVIKGKGLRIANGAKNVIIQNIHFTDMNPQYIWGGDAIALDNSDLVWIDHVKFSLIGRQMFATSSNAARRVAVTNTEFDGVTSWSASCNGKHYWTFLTVGSNDRVTFQGNYIHDTSGRGPKVGGDSTTDAFMHAVGNYWENVEGHAFDVLAGGRVVTEGNVFESVTTSVLDTNNSLFAAASSNAASCKTYMGRECQPNSLSSSGAFVGDATSVLDVFKGYTIAAAHETSLVKASVLSYAGVGKI